MKYSLFKGYLKQLKTRVSARVSRPRSSAKKGHPNWSRLGNSALDILGGTFCSRDFSGFRFLPPFDHPRHLKPELENDGSGGRERGQGGTSCFFPLAHAPLPTVFLLDLCLSFARLWLLLYRRGSRINTDRFPKRAPKAQASSGVREQAPPGKNWIFTP